MPQFAAELNKDSLGRITSARYDTDAAKWLSDVGMHTKNDAGLWVPVSATDPMPAKLTGSTVDRRGLAAAKPAANSVPAGTTYWSIDTDPHGSALEVSNGAAWVVI